MPCVSVNPTFWAVLGLGLGGSVVGVIFRVWETRTRRPRGILLPAVLAITFCGLAVVAWLTNQPGGMALSGAGVAAACLLGWAGCVPGPYRDRLRRFAPRAVWGLLLIAPPASSLYLARGVGQNAPGIEDLVANQEVTPIRNDRLRAETDQGREIPLYNFKEP